MIFTYYLATENLTNDLSLEGSSTGDNLNQLGGNSSLTGTVVSQRQFVNHVGSVLRGVLHGIHTRRLLGGGVLHETMEDLGGQGVFEEVGQSLGVQLWFHLVLVIERVVVIQQGAGLDGLDRGNVHDGRLEFVVQDVDSIGLGGQDLTGDSTGQAKVVRGHAISQGSSDLILEHSAQLRSTLLTGNNNLECLVLGSHPGGQLSGHSGEDGVNTTAQTLVSGQHNKQVLLGEVRHVMFFQGLVLSSNSLRPALYTYEHPQHN
jgi:hypothetical protein